MYQKSPFPYIIVLVAIIGISCVTNLTIDKEIEQPIIHVIDQESANINIQSTELELAENITQIAYSQ